MARPWYAHYERDYSTKTKWFTCASQHGIYRGLIAHINIEGPVDDIDEELRAICGATELEWSKYWPDIRKRMKFFVNDDGKLDQERAAEERKRAKGGYSSKSRRARTAANARWKKHREGEAAPPAPAAAPTGPTPLDDLSAAVAVWNEMAQRIGLSLVQNMSKTRRAALAKRLKELKGLDGWKIAVAKVEKIPGMLGGNDRGWKVTFDFLLQPSRLTKLMEGGYDGWGTKTNRDNNYERAMEALSRPYQGDGRMGDVGAAAAPNDPGTIDADFSVLGEDGSGR